MNNEELKQLIEVFYNQWVDNDELWRNGFFPQITQGYVGYKIKISFGQGMRIVSPKNPWMAFLKYNQRVSQGVYPIIIIQDNLLKVFLGISRENDSNLELSFIEKLKEKLGYREFTIREINDLLNHIDTILAVFDSEINNHIDDSVEHLVNKFKNYLKDSKLELKTDSHNKKFSVILKNQKIIVITSNNEEVNVESTTRKALKEKDLQSRGGWSYPPVIARYILDNELTVSENEVVVEDIIGPNTLPNPGVDKIKNIILYGSPGVGKTHNINKLISLIESRVSEKEIFEIIKNNEENNGIDANRIVKNISSRVKFITFHQSFGYEDFIEGFRPNEDGDIKLQDGIFKTICNDADNNRDSNFYLVIDEINRGNISKIFGELITLIEEDKRDTLEVTLPYSKKPFKIPSNLYIIGTMNSTDKSIALIDIALRRRFTFLKMEPNLDLVKNVEAKNIMKQLNEKITETLGADYVLGHSYFMKIKKDDDDDLNFILEYKIKPLLEEYFYGDVNGYDQVIKVIDDNA